MIQRLRRLAGLFTTIEWLRVSLYWKNLLFSFCTFDITSTYSSRRFSILELELYPGRAYIKIIGLSFDIIKPLRGRRLITLAWLDIPLYSNSKETMESVNYLKKNWVKE